MTFPDRCLGKPLPNESQHRDGSTLRREGGVGQLAQGEDGAEERQRHGREHSMLFPHLGDFCQVSDDGTDNIFIIFVKFPNDEIDRCSAYTRYTAVEYI